ncbi:MAG TPA: hypothetical protein VN878_06635 [Usitatibacter sp.]|nr:hypothetical protein [Usitatibacter sp.]
MGAALALILLTAAFGAAASELPSFAELEQALKLNPEQKAQFDVAVAATQRALLSVAAGGVQLKERLQQEFSKTSPDLRALAQVQEALIEQSRPFFRDARDAWARLFEMLNDDQVAIAKSRLQGPLERLWGAFS